MERYLVTGATGYIGSMLVKYIMERDKEAQITVLVRDGKKAEGMFPVGVRIVTADLTDRAEVKRLEVTCDYLVHCASVTKSAEMVSHPVEVTESIVNAAQNVLELAGRCGVRSMVYLSSMEVYGTLDCGADRRAAENEAAQGVVELLSLRSCYPLGKRMAENICYCYYREYGIPVKIARLAQTFGRGILSEENRVFAQFARAAREGTDIVLRTRGESVGNYCGIQDAVKGILVILEKGENGQAYNVVNERNTMTIKEMAELVAEKIARKKIQVIYDIPAGNPYGYAQDTGLRLSGKRLMELGWTPAQGMEEMYLEMMGSLENAAGGTGEEKNIEQKISLSHIL